MFLFPTFHESITDGGTDGGTDGPTDGPRDTPSYRDTRKHPLKMRKRRERTKELKEMQENRKEERDGISYSICIVTFHRKEEV